MNKDYYKTSVLCLHSNITVYTICCWWLCMQAAKWQMTGQKWWMAAASGRAMFWTERIYRPNGTLQCIVVACCVRCIVIHGGIRLRRDYGWILLGIKCSCERSGAILLQIEIHYLLKRCFCFLPRVSCSLYHAMLIFQPYLSPDPNINWVIANNNNNNNNNK